MTGVSDALTERATPGTVFGSSIFAWWHASPPLWKPCAGSRTLGLLRQTWVFWGTAAIACIAVASAFVVFPHARLALALLAGAGMAAFALPKAGLAVLPAALIWSPKIDFVVLGQERLFLRLDHAIVGGLLLHVLGRGRLRDTPLYVWLGLFLAATGLGAALGLVRGTAPSSVLTAAYVMQIVHLFAVFAIAFSLGGRLGKAGLYAWIIPVLALAAYGVAEQVMPLEPVVDNIYRTYERAWFERQANHAAGLLAFAAVVGVAVACERRRRTLGVCTAVAACLALAGTHSREGALALAVGLVCLAGLKSSRARKWLVLTAFMGAAALALAPDGAWAALAPDDGSLYHRISHWKGALAEAPGHAMLGMGLGARHRRFYDNHYVMLLAETGLVGAGLFLVWLASLARALRHGGSRPGMRGALCFGVLAGLAGVAVQGMAATCFVVSLLAGPVYCLAGYALSLEPESP